MHGIKGSQKSCKRNLQTIHESMQKQMIIIADRLGIIVDPSDVNYVINLQKLTTAASMFSLILNIADDIRIISVFSVDPLAYCNRFTRAHKRAHSKFCIIHHTYVM